MYANLSDFRNVVQLTSGLGNQMFQYAFGRAVGAAYDVSWFSCDCGTASVPRKFELPLFHCELPIADPTEVMRRVRCRKLWRLLGCRPRLQTVRESDAGVFKSEYLTMENANFVGYFQSEKYFLPLRDELLGAFRLRDPSREFLDCRARLLGRTTVSVHVRRGDYLRQNVLGLCDADYYRAAMRHVRERVPNPVFCFFSDDGSWTHEAFGNEPDVLFQDHAWDNAACDLLLMSACRHHIIANSTYSWWGAWLDDSPGKIVVAPRRWLAKGDCPDTVPASWVRI